MKKTIFLLGIFCFFNSAFALDNFIGRTDFYFIETGNNLNSILVDPVFDQDIPFLLEIDNKFSDVLNIKLGALDGVRTKGDIVKKSCKESYDENQFSDYVSFEKSDFFVLSGSSKTTSTGTFNFPSSMSGIKFGCIYYYPIFSGSSDEVKTLTRKAIIVDLINSDLWVNQSFTGNYLDGSGALLTFTVTFGNNGDFPANGVSIMSALTGLELLSSSPNYNYSDGNLTYRSGFTLNSGQIQTIVFTAVITQDFGLSTSFLKISFDGYDPYPENSTSYLEIDLGIMADIHVNHSYGKTMTGDFWFFVRNGIEWTQVYNSAKNTNQKRIFIDSAGIGQVKINLIPSGEEFLAVFKGDGNLSVGYTGVYNTSIIRFDFEDFVSHTNLYPSLVYDDRNFLIMGDVEFVDIATYDLVHDLDFNTESYNLTLGTNLLFDLGDFDINNIINAIDQSILIGNIQKKGFIYQIDLPGRPYYNYRGLNPGYFR